MKLNGNFKQHIRYCQRKISKRGHKSEETAQQARQRIKKMKNMRKKSQTRMIELEDPTELEYEFQEKKEKE